MPRAETLLLSATRAFLDDAAQAVTQRCVQALPDLSHVVVLVPVMASASGVLRALGQAAAQRGHSSILPPRVTTLDAWAETVPLIQTVTPAVLRNAQLRQILKARGWYGSAPPWEACEAILQLADELSAALPSPIDEAEFTALVAKHYQRANLRLAAPEAKLVYEVWRAFAPAGAAGAGSGGGSGGTALDPALARRLRLAALLKRCAETVEGAQPLLIISTQTGATLERSVRDFADAWSAHQPVTVIGLQALPDWWPDAAVGAVPAPLAPAAHHPLNIVAAHSLEAEAFAIANQVKRWLVEGKRDIALIAQDRLTARRARALLERDQILLADESGWKLSTTSAASCLMRWLDCVSGGFAQHDLLDWLKSPFVFGDVAADARAAATGACETALRRENIPAGLASLRPALRADQAGQPNQRERDAATDALAMLDRIDSAARPWTRRNATLSEWCALARSTLRVLGAESLLAADAAGQQMLDLLLQLELQLGSEPGPVTTTEWRAFAANRFEAAVFRDSAIDSPVVLTTLRGARLRRFDAVLLIGAGAVHLDGADEEALLLTTRLRGQLGLATRQQRRREQRDDLALLLALAGAVCATWRASAQGEPQPLAAWFVQLDMARLARGDASLITHVTAPAYDIRRQQTAPPLPSAAALTPEHISVSAYATLIACPYRFFARHMLHLNELEEVREEFEKRDYGEWVHAVLNRFHQRFPAITGVQRNQLCGAMQEITEREFAPKIAFNHLSLGWKLRWQERIGAYLDWQLEHEAQGWRWQAGEVKASAAIAQDGGAGLVLYGRLDRIDVKSNPRTSDEETLILDYKAQALTTLRAKLKQPGEDVQLASYQLLLGERAPFAAFVALDGDAVKPLYAAEVDALEVTPEIEYERLARTFAQIRSGAPLPANAPDAVCQHCEMRGLCRKDYWQTR